jgi:hypothetical protein
MNRLRKNYWYNAYYFHIIQLQSYPVLHVSSVSPCASSFFLDNVVLLHLNSFFLSF